MLGFGVLFVFFCPEAERPAIMDFNFFIVSFSIIFWIQDQLFYRLLPLHVSAAHMLVPINGKVKVLSNWCRDISVFYCFLTFVLASVCRPV